MFDLDAGKLIVIGVVALIAIPSKDLPRVLRQLGQAVGRVRRMAAEFQGQFMEAMREAELHELRQEVDKVKESVKLDGAFDPLGEARKQIMQATESPFSPPPRPEAAAYDEFGHLIEHPVSGPTVAEAPAEAPAATPQPAETKPPQGDAGV